MSENSDSNPNLQQASAQWADMIGQLFDRLTGKGASVTYAFDNLVIDIPRAQGPGGQDLGAARWTINGKLIITAETHESSEASFRPNTISAESSAA